MTVAPPLLRCDGFVPFVARSTERQFEFWRRLQQWLTVEGGGLIENDPTFTLSGTAICFSKVPRESQSFSLSALLSPEPRPLLRRPRMAPQWNGRSRIYSFLDRPGQPHHDHRVSLLQRYLQPPFKSLRYLRSPPAITAERQASHQRDPRGRTGLTNPP